MKTKLFLLSLLTVLFAVQSVYADAPKGVEMVDLGLSVKWANMNIGATKPEEYGDYFAWGETSPKTTYYHTRHKYWNGSVMTKYGYIDHKWVLELIDDAAHMNWGGNWRMPTYAELDELRNNCTWTWTTQNGVKGYIVKGKNSNSIFLPAAGYRYGDELDGVNGSGNYWASTDSKTAGWDLAMYLGFYYGHVDGDVYYREAGFSVRAVCP